MRIQAEQLWENIRNFRKVVAFFNNNGENFNIENVRNHLRRHYMVQEQNIRRRYYADHIRTIINHKLSRSKRIELYIAMIEDKAWKYASMEHEDEEKGMKNDEMLLKCMKQTNELVKLQSELEGDIKPLMIFKDRIQQIFISTINKTSDPKLKMEMLKEVESLKELDE